jgi:tetratricopeptide (TPR) repeat protein
MATRRTGERVTLSVIRETYFNGDFEKCLMMCDGFAPRDADDTSEIVLLRARCLVQLRRGDHAVAVLRGLRVRDDQRDEYLTGRMLLSAAYVSLGRLDEGLKIARDAYDEIEDAHATIRAEVTLNLATAHWRKGQYAQASRLLEAIPEADDIVYIRALQVRGFVAWGQGDYAGSLDRFHESLARLDACRYQDRYLESSLLFSLHTSVANYRAFKCGRNWRNGSSSSTGP